MPIWAFFFAPVVEMLYIDPSLQSFALPSSASCQNQSSHLWANHLTESFNARRSAIDTFLFRIVPCDDLLSFISPFDSYKHKKSARPMSFNSHGLTLNMPLFFCKRNGLGGVVFFVFLISLSIVNITHSKTPENRQQADILQTLYGYFADILKKVRFTQC